MLENKRLRVEIKSGKFSSIKRKVNMFNESIVRKTVKKYVDNGIKRYVIYPFGTNGMTVKTCLEECFGISPVMVVDKEYSQYNTNIVNIDELKKSYCEDMCVILTAEDRRLNIKLEKNLLTFVSSNHVINLLTEKEKEQKIRKEYEVGNRFSLKNILPQKSVVSSNIKEGKIKIRIISHSYTSWNSVKTISDAFEKEDRFDVLVILNEELEYSNLYLEKDKKMMEKEGHKYVLGSEYCVEEDKPDILIIHHPYTKWYIKGSREHTKLIIAVPMALIRYSYSIEEYWKYINVGLERWKPDYYLFDSVLFNELLESPFYSDRIIEMGNAKFDGIFNACVQSNYPVGWEKLKEKKIVLLTTDHGIHEGMVSDNITFDLYAKTIFTYAQKNVDMAFILRLHPTFISELIRGGYWSEETLNIIKKYCEDTPNVIWDDQDTYDASFSLADAILTEPFCGITISALPTLKPICVMYRNDMKVVPYHKEIVENYYSAHSVKELTDFFDMIRKEEDPMLERRKEMCQRYVKHFDGKNGERIKNFIVKVFEAVEKD